MKGGVLVQRCQVDTYISQHACWTRSFCLFFGWSLIGEGGLSGPCVLLFRIETFFGQGGKGRRDGLVYPGVYLPASQLNSEY